MLRRLFLFLALLLPLTTAAPALAQSAPTCQYILGFATLHSLDATDTGDCLDNQAFAANGDAQQHTTNGLMAWRKADNWTAFTNGYWTWINGPNGLAKRLNTQRYSWEANPDGLPLVDASSTVVAPVSSPPVASGQSTYTPAPSAPAGQYPSDITAACNDGTYSYSAHASGTCSHHGGVQTWVNHPAS